LSYPPPPWQTFGDAWFRPYLVRAADVRVPAPLEIEARAGMTLGLLGFVEYRAPSPLRYRELLWMPARVRSGSMRGYWVAKMYVDDEDSLAAGRTEWALPKQLARFDQQNDRVRVDCEDGARWTIEIGKPPLRAKLRNRITTLQVEAGRVVRFRGDTKAPAGPAKVRVSEATGLDGTWMGFASARALPLGVALSGFTTTMREAERT
jgi:hypothetical protein